MPTIRDVALLAGVSHQTVSRVINNSPNIRPETRDRVLVAIEELGYRPSALAQGLARGSSQRVGILIESAYGFGPMGILSGFESVAREAGYAVTAYTVPRTSSEQFKGGFDFLLDQVVDAIAIIVARTKSVESIRDIDSNIPTVIVAIPEEEFRREPEALKAIAVSVDQKAGSKLAVEHLLKLGHRRIAHITGPLDWVDARIRFNVWRECLENAGLVPDVWVEGDWGADSGFAAANQIAANPDITAVFAGNDQMALGLIHGLTELGISVPGDISVVGFDGSPESGHFLPPLTTVQQDFTQLGRIGMVALLNQLGKGPALENTVMQPSLLGRSSTRAI